jgi:hypothetical protein
MKKLLSIISIALLATTGVFAITVTEVNNATSTPTSLSDIILKVDAVSPGTADVLLKYQGSSYSGSLSDTSWKITDTSASTNITDVFTVVFSAGAVSSTSGNSTETYKVIITPGAFLNDSTGTSAIMNTTGDPLIPTPNWVNANDGGGGESEVTTITSPMLNVLTITSEAINTNVYISEKTIAGFTLGWNSVDANIVINPSGAYTSTTTVTIETI